MNNLEQKKLFELYTLAEITYQNHFESLVKDIELLYPEGWYQEGKYKDKIEIIGEAIRQNQLIEKTEKYSEYIKIKNPKVLEVSISK